MAEERYTAVLAFIKEELEYLRERYKKEGAYSRLGPSLIHHKTQINRKIDAIARQKGLAEGLANEIKNEVNSGMDNFAQELEEEIGESVRKLSRKMKTKIPPLLR